MRFLRFLFGRWRRADSRPIREKDAYAHSYGDRTGEVFAVTRMPEPEPAPEPEPEPQAEAPPEPELDATPEPEPEATPEAEAESEPQPVPIGHRMSGLTDALLRRAFAAKLDARHHKTAS